MKNQSKKTDLFIEMLNTVYIITLNVNIERQIYLDGMHIGNGMHARCPNTRKMDCRGIGSKCSTHSRPFTCRNMNYRANIVYVNVKMVKQIKLQQQQLNNCANKQMRQK